MRNAGRYYLAGALLVAGGGELRAAADVPDVHVIAGGRYVAGKVKDGARLSQGRLVFRGRHTGFQVWSEAPASGSQPGHYLLTGRENSGHVLRVRLGKAGWQPDAATGRGIKLYSAESVATFDVVADGDQTVMADRYENALDSAAILP